MSKSKIENLTKLNKENLKFKKIEKNIKTSEETSFTFEYQVKDIPFIEKIALVNSSFQISEDDEGVLDFNIVKRLLQFFILSECTNIISSQLKESATVSTALTILDNIGDGNLEDILYSIPNNSYENLLKIFESKKEEYNLQRVINNDELIKLFKDMPDISKEDMDKLLSLSENIQKFTNNIPQ